MSFGALAWAGKCRPGSASRKLVLFALADRHNDEADGAYPSIAWIADFTGLNRKTIITCLADLERLTFIADSGERRGDTAQIKLYRLHLETVPLVEQSQKRNSSEKVAKQSQKRDTDTVRTGSRKKAAPSTRGRAKPKIPLPDGWEPKPLTAGSVCAQIVAVWQPGRMERELSKFRDHHLRSGQEWKDWDAAWRTWIQNAGNFENGHHRQPASGQGPPQRRSPALELYKRGALREVEEADSGEDGTADWGTGASLPAFGPS